MTSKLPDLTLPLILTTLLLAAPTAGHAGPAEPPAGRTALTTRDGELTLERAPEPAAGRARLEAWHRIYQRHGRPLPALAGEVLANPDEDAVEAGCRRLARRLLGAEEAGVLAAPDFAVRHHVRSGMSRLTRAVTVCLTGHLTAARLHLGEARRSLFEADRLLARHGL